MWWLRRRRFARGFDGARVAEAIGDAERGTAGEIVVSIAPFFLGSIQRAAERAYDRLGIARTRARAGVLFFVCPGRRLLFLLGDAAIHEKVGQAFWDRVAADVSRRFANGDFTGGIVEGVAEVGRALRLHFPDDAADRENQLPNEPDMPP